MPIFNLHQLRNFLFIIATTLFLSACQIESKPTSELDQIKQRGVLRVGTLNNQLSYYIGPDGQTGLDYELARQFADELGVKLEVKVAFRQAELFPMLKRGDIDLIATGLNQTPRAIKQFRPGPSYYYVSQVVVYKNGALRPRNLKQLVEYQNAKTASEDEAEASNNAAANTLQVVKQSQNVTLLKSLQSDYPELQFTTVSDADNYDLLRRVSTGELRFAISDSIELSLAQRLYPDLATAFEVTEDQPVSWFVRRSPDESLYALMIEFFGNISQSDELARLEEKYIGHIGSFDYVDTRAFIRALDNKLPKWAPLFEQYSAEFDWRLIAALAYQESHWNPLAKSPTGVRGMMMLTLPTAQSVGVKNRLDPEQSIRGGVEYLRRIVARVPESIPQHEKIWFALASYNVGFGHMMDARRLTKRQGGDPDSWGDVKERLPLLRQKKYFSQTRYGYARGDEAKNYVENIRRYYQSIIGHVGQNSLIASDQEGEIQVIPPLENSELVAASDIDAAENEALSPDVTVSQAALTTEVQP
ncbi:membrane-bound lytic murein transglycosylase MltF [Vibrio vulnificus]|uniref:membrane-bound lytic murein transglycosylase MltF n=1 Tax=Vibrio vulnificus TaxID=672 RepID=UPI00092BD28D|nr:membrane-bound lytic murein transglycosylase MltF [Vibrio vulnificus]ELH7531253.1 membrane-bound lytic murein transglycosylase MltF [Vibrio vulnificus]ELH7532836.1 membrane-bound lytic murein transglycosylase MltF [Vibrio vulnificus]MCU8520484.1 membrane-bound lytic murein transglycosylase MltF [Vibrio vulnificus]OJH76637.1 Membrane-bound lytic murein transglycosylase F precursor [Vibrio vulnificus]POB59523.1 membrane-bound lytic murein transglycosylase MltF [Vibrio vulnificus]